MLKRYYHSDIWLSSISFKTRRETNEWLLNAPSSFANCVSALNTFWATVTLFFFLAISARIEGKKIIDPLLLRCLDK